MESLGIARRLALLGFNAYAFGAVALVPPTAFPAAHAELYHLYFAKIGQRLGFVLPSTYLTFPPQVPWESVHPFFQTLWPGWSLGLVVTLVVLPSVAVAAVRVLRRDRRRFRLLAPMLVAGSALATLCLTMSYHPSHLRYLIEPTVSLLLLGPLCLRELAWKRPLFLGPVISTLLAAVLVWETARVVAATPQFDAALVASTPRTEQYARFANPYRIKFSEAADRIETRYPVTEYPEIAVQVANLQTTHAFQYSHLTAIPHRRVSYWVDNGPTAPPPTVPVVTPVRGVAARFEADPRVFVDSLAPGIWLIVPLDRMAVSWKEESALQSGYPVLSIEAHVDPARVPQARYRFGVAPSYEALGWTADAGWVTDGKFEIRLVDWMLIPTSEDAYVDLRARLFVEVGGKDNRGRIERRSISLNRMVYGWDAR
jgi:hypothetical protein